MPPLPADLPSGQDFTAYVGPLAVPYGAAFGGVVVPTTPGYLLRRGHIAEGFGGDILAPLLWVPHHGSISLAPLFVPSQVLYCTPVPGVLVWTPSPCFSRAPPGLQSKV